MTTARVLDPAVLAGLGGLTIRVEAVVEGVLTGLHRSPFRGASSEFAEHKEYSPGDEIRNLDWKLVARTERYFVKQFHEESNLVAYLLLDASASMDFGAPLTKHDYAAVLAGSLTYLLAAQIDMVGLLIADANGPMLTTARAGRAHVQHVLDRLQASVPRGATSLAEAIDALGEQMRRRALVFVLSDFLGDEAAMVAALNRLRSRAAQIVLLQVLTPAELRLNFFEAARFADPESQTELVADPAAAREHYLAELGAFLARLREESLARGMAYRLVETAEPPDRVLREVLRTT